jgi:hypothetical protein
MASWAKAQAVKGSAFQLAKANCNRYLLPLALADGQRKLPLFINGLFPKGCLGQAQLAIIDLSKISKNYFYFNNLCFF